MRDQSANHVFLQAKSKIEVGPSLVPVFQDRHAEDKVVYIFDVALAFAFVTEAEDHAGNFYIGKGHVVGGAREHETEVV